LNIQVHQVNVALAASNIIQRSGIGVKIDPAIADPACFDEERRREIEIAAFRRLTARGIVQLSSVTKSIARARFAALLPPSILQRFAGILQRSTREGEREREMFEGCHRDKSVDCYRRWTIKSAWLISD